MHTPRQSCQYAAIALAMSARVGPVYRPEVAGLVLLAVLLDDGDPLAVACITFARGACDGSAKSGTLVQLGYDLHRAIERSTWPDGASSRQTSDDS